MNHRGRDLREGHRQKESLIRNEYVVAEFV
jgi:hypothetical protein